MKKMAFLLLIAFHSLDLFSQVDTSSVYGALETKKFYAVGTSSSITGGKTAYKVEGSIVKKAEYDKYHSTWENMDTCCPCILKSYDVNDVLLSEVVSCTDCGVGDYKKFYPNGKLKLKGKFRENPTGQWGDIYKRGYCSVPDGTWLYFNERGQINCIEIWDNGNFIEQKPKSKKVEIWKVELSLNDVAVDTQRIALNEFRDLQFTPKYKNSNRGLGLRLKLSVSAVGYKYIEKEIRLDQFGEVEIQNLIKQVGTSELEKISVQIGVYEKGVNIWNFYLKLKE